MGYIKEPKNVDLVVGPSVLTNGDLLTISNAIAEYRKTRKRSANSDEIPQSLNSNKSAIGSSAVKNAAKV